MIKRRILLALVLVSVVIHLAITGCSPASSSGSQPPSPTPATSGGETPDVISAEAVVIPYREANLSFGTGGTIRELLVSEGDTVVAGQELAKLDTRTLALMVRRAEAGLAAAQAQLARTKAGALPEEIALSEADVSVAEGNVASARASLQSAQASLKKAEAGPTARDLQIAQKQVELAKNQLWAAQNQRDTVGGQAGGSGTDYEYTRAQAAVVETQVDIAELQLEEIKAGAREEDLAVVRAQVTQAQSALQIAEAQLQKARTALALVRAGARAEDIAIAQAPVAEAEVGLEEARTALADSVLIAPFAGTVGTILLEEGELTAPQTPVLILGDVSILRVRTLDLGEADVSHVQVGQQAVVTVDALGGKQLKGKVVRVAPSATERRGDTVYAVILDLEVGADSGLKWGMTAFVEIALQ